MYAVIGIVLLHFFKTSLVYVGSCHFSTFAHKRELFYVGHANALTEKLGEGNLHFILFRIKNLKDAIKRIFLLRF